MCVCLSLSFSHSLPHYRARAGVSTAGICLNIFQGKQLQPHQCNGNSVTYTLRWVLFTGKSTTYQFSEQTTTNLYTNALQHISNDEAFLACATIAKLDLVFTRRSVGRPLKQFQ